MLVNWQCTYVITCPKLAPFVLFLNALANTSLIYSLLNILLYVGMYTNDFFLQI
jgi:hypothetical protein